MGLTVVIGDRSAGKTGAVYERVRAAVQKGMTAAVLLPTLPERERAVRELGALQPLGVSVETLDSFLDGLWHMLGDGRKVIGHTRRRLLLRQVMERLGPQMGRSMPASAAGRILDVLVQRAAEREAIAPLSAPADPLADFLATAIADYERELTARGLIEEAAARMAAARAATRQDLPDLVCVNRFETFTPPQLKFLETAAQAGSDVVVALTYVEGSSVTRAVDGLLRSLSELSGSQVIAVNGAPPGSCEELVKLQSSLARETRESVAGGAVQLIAARGSRGEAEATAATVAEMVDTGISPDRIAIVARGIDRRIRRLGAALDAMGVPWRYEGAWQLRDSGLGRAVLSLLRLATEGRREHVVSFLQSGYAGVGEEEADRFARWMRSQRTAHGDEARRAAAGAPGEAGRIVREMFAACKSEDAAATLAALRRIADGMLVNRYGDAPVLDMEGRLDAKVRQAVLDAAAATLEARGRLDAAQLVDLLHETRIPADDGIADGVVVSGPERVRARRFDALVVLGMGADEFPRTESGLGLPRRALRHLERLGIDAAPRAGLDEERLLFYQVITGARQKLVLIWQAVDDDGNEKDPSLFVDEILDAYRPGRGPGVITFGTQLLALAPGAGAPGPPGRIPRGGPPALVRRECPDLPDDVLEALAQRTAFSASELEAYLRCPRRWLYEHGIGPAGIDVVIDARERGRTAHRILQRFYECWQELGHQRVTPALLPRALEVHAEVAAQTQQGAPTPESFEEQAEMRRAVVGTRRVLERDAVSFQGFAPVAHEVAFGEGERDALDLDGWQLKGRIDRIDAGEAGLVVCDYKTGGGVGAARFEEDRVLQAPLYSYAAARLYGRPVVGMIYRTMSLGRDRGAYVEGVVTSPWLSSADARDAAAIDALIRAALGRAAYAVEGIRSGNIRPEPYQDQACAQCIARTWCEGSRA